MWSNVCKTSHFSSHHSAKVLLDVFTLLGFVHVLTCIYSVCQCLLLCVEHLGVGAQTDSVIYRHFMAFLQSKSQKSEVVSLVELEPKAWIDAVCWCLLNMCVHVWARAFSTLGRTCMCLPHCSHSLDMFGLSAQSKHWSLDQSSIWS